jgi:plastocyanin
MHFSTVTSVALLGALASAKDIAVTVGPDIAFHPNTITAAKGDTVTFKINSGHSVMGGAFNAPCVASTFSSGAQGAGKSFQIKVNDTNPIYGFCGAPTHCETGMIFTINAP